LTIRSNGSKLPVHFRYDGVSMAYTIEDSAESPSQRPKFALAGIVASRLDIALVTAVVAAEDALARLDERLRASPLRDGFCARAHFHDACASLWLAGELVHLEDLVLHDAEMDLRTPTHELTRAHAVLRGCRRIAGAAPGRFLGGGLDDLRGKGEAAAQEQPAAFPVADVDPLGEEFAALDAAIERSSRLLRQAPGAAAPSTQAATDPARALIYDEDFDEAGRLADWRREVESTQSLPPTLAAAIALEAWRDTEPLEHQNWFGPLLVADLLRQRGKALSHLPCLNVGLRAIPRERRQSPDRTTRIGAALDAIQAAARAGLEELDRLALAEARFRRRCQKLKSNARLPALAEFVLSKPLVTAPMIARHLNISARAAQDMAPALGLRELTGRTRFRAWGV
jgi:hypothetical protein